MMCHIARFWKFWGWRFLHTCIAILPAYLQSSMKAVGLQIVYTAQATVVVSSEWSFYLEYASEHQKQ